MKTMKERMLTGDLYIPSLTEGLRDLSIKGKKLAQQYNRLDFDDFEGRRALLKQLFGKTGERFTWSNLSMWTTEFIQRLAKASMRILTVHY